jgi:hypothetical protein
VNTSDDDDFHGGFAKTFIENQEMEAMEAYQRRGRPLQKLDDQQLQQRWVASMEAWANAPSARRVIDARDRDDLEAEMRLRGTEPPASLRSRQSFGCRRDLVTSREAGSIRVFLGTRYRAPKTKPSDSD